MALQELYSETVCRIGVIDPISFKVLSAIDKKDGLVYEDGRAYEGKMVTVVLKEHQPNYYVYYVYYGDELATYLLNPPHWGGVVFGINEYLDKKKGSNINIKNKKQKR